MSRQIAGRFLLLLALVAGWQAALLHPITHVDADGGLVHRHDGQSPGAGELCDALAALTTCASDFSHPFTASAQVADAVQFWRNGAPRTADALPFLSQGPPAAP
jgi:hypothetical protein